ncbi:MAG TPA: 3,4-dihydroxy-2-butanone-4-phosphate synthase [Dictyobacter sp.]|nr:3,4-dihydroxy-2-butanone-4-phosphate synthase [Dictyobacter sp.]
MMATTEQHLRLLSIEEAANEIRAGRMVLICDDEGRENEADLCIAAQFATPEAINFISHAACGLICVALAGERLDTLRIPLAERKNNPLQGTAFTLSVDVRHNVTTGISARDRATTIHALIDPAAQPDDFASPGHIFPLRACAGGTLERRGHTEASVDLMRIAGVEPGAVICEVLASDGEAARGETLTAMAQEWQIGMITVDAIARYRQEHTVNVIARTHLPTSVADFQLQDYQEITTGKQYLALSLGDVQTLHNTAPLVRLHSSCTTGDIFGCQRCDCQAQLQTALAAIAQEERGLLLYLPQEGRGIGLAAKLQAYAIQDHGINTARANEQLGYQVDARDYTAAIAILRELNLTHVRLLTNNPLKVKALSEAGIQVERVPLEITPGNTNLHYLQTKQQILGHMLTHASLTTLPAMQTSTVSL